eukprot:scaffold11209_cov99-Isochrysis_galbana.AAC.2
MASPLRGTLSVLSTEMGCSPPWRERATCCACKNSASACIAALLCAIPASVTPTPTNRSRPCSRDGSDMKASRPASVPRVPHAATGYVLVWTVPSVSTVSTS